MSSNLPSKDQGDLVESVMGVLRGNAGHKHIVMKAGSSNEIDSISGATIDGVATLNRLGRVDVRGNVTINNPVEKISDVATFDIVSGTFKCGFASLKSLEGAPTQVGGDFICGTNNLTSLHGSPRVVKGSFSCSFNKLKTLIGGPEFVGGDYVCAGNMLMDLVGACKNTVETFDCSDNPLETLDGLPPIRKTLIIRRTKIHMTDGDTTAREIIS